MFFLNLGVLFVLFFEIEFLHSSDWPGTHYEDQAGLKLTDPPASVSQVQELKHLCLSDLKFSNLKTLKCVIASFWRQYLFYNNVNDHVADF